MYPLKISENRKFSNNFAGYRKRILIKLIVLFNGKYLLINTTVQFRRTTFLSKYKIETADYNMVHAVIPVSHSDYRYFFLLAVTA